MQSITVKTRVKIQTLLNCHPIQYSTGPANKVFAWRLTPHSLNQCCISPYCTQMIRRWSNSVQTIWQRIVHLFYCVQILWEWLTQSLCMRLVKMEISTNHRPREANFVKWTFWMQHLTSSIQSNSNYWFIVYVFKKIHPHNIKIC